MIRGLPVKPSCTENSCKVTNTKVGRTKVQNVNQGLLKVLNEINRR